MTIGRFARNGRVALSHSHRQTLRTSSQRAVECYRRAATAGDGHGHPDAWYNLGTIYFEGGPGVPRDAPMAIECFAAAAASPQETSGSAAYWLGHLYRIGDAPAGKQGQTVFFVFRRAQPLSSSSSPDRHRRPAQPGQGPALPAGGLRGQAAPRGLLLPGGCPFTTTDRSKPLPPFFSSRPTTPALPLTPLSQALLFRNGERELELVPDPKAFQTYLQRAEALGDAEALFCLADMHMHGGWAGWEREVLVAKQPLT